MIYLVGGRAGEGKTTFSTMCCGLLDDIPNGIYAFAHGVKETARFMGWDGVKDERGRALLQAVGNSGRDYRPNLWVERELKRIWREQSSNLPNDCAFFIDDWRFPNEEVVAKQMFGEDKIVTVRVIRPQEQHALWGKPNYNDVSESSLPVLGYYYDHIINNETNSLDDLQKLAERFVEEIIR
jgi:hypothetical protein